MKTKITLFALLAIIHFSAAGMSPATLNSQLQEAVIQGNCDSAEKWLKLGADVNFLNENGETLLFHLLGNADCAMRNFGNDKDDPEMVKLLLEHGANPSIQDKYRYDTALHRAINPRSVNAFFTHIPATIIQNRLVGIRAIRFAKPELPRDIRKIIIRKIINDLIQDHVSYLIQLVAKTNRFENRAIHTVLANTIYDIPISIRRRLLEIHKMLSFSADPISRQQLGEQVASNIWNLLSIL